MNIGKRYIPMDNSYILKMGEVDNGMNHNPLYGQETIIVSEPYDATVKSIGLPPKVVTFINVMFNKNVFRVMWKDGWIHKDDVGDPDSITLIRKGGKSYVVISI